MDLIVTRSYNKTTIICSDSKIQYNVTPIYIILKMYYFFRFFSLSPCHAHSKYAIVTVSGQNKYRTMFILFPKTVNCKNNHEFSWGQLYHIYFFRCWLIATDRSPFISRTSVVCGGQELKLVPLSSGLHVFSPIFVSVVRNSPNNQ